MLYEFHKTKFNQTYPIYGKKFQYLVDTKNSFLHIWLFTTEMKNRQLAT